MPPEEKPSLADAIHTAIATEDKKDEATNADKTKDSKIDDKTDKDKKDDKEAKKDPADKKADEDEDAVQGKQLLQALRNPETAPAIIDFLIKQTGHKVDAPIKTETKKEEIKDDILSIISSELGDEFAFLSPKLAKALDKILTNKLSESTREIKATLEEKELENLNKQATEVRKELADKYFDKPDIPADIEKEMQDAMKRIEPTPGQTVKSYLEDLFYTVMGRRGTLLTTKDQRVKADKNKQSDVLNKLTSNRATVPSKDTDGKSTKMTLSEAIAAAEESVSKDS